MVHQYKNNGYNIVLDVCSGSVHVVDDLVYDMIAMYKDKKFEEIEQAILEKYGDTYSKEDIKDAYSDISELEEKELLFTEDVFKDVIIDFKKRKTVVKALCLHIAHDCNLACKYCFADEGEYHGQKRELMSLEVGKQAIDFLIENSGNRVNLEVDFFGGEPLMNFDVVKEIVAYGRSKEKAANKNFRFTLTTCDANDTFIQCSSGTAQTIRSTWHASWIFLQEDCAQALFTANRLSCRIAGI